MKIFNDLQLAKELIKFPTVTPVDAGIMKFLEKKLKLIGFKTKILEFKDGNSTSVKNIYARLGTKGPNFCYAGHVDVVPPGNLKNWSSNPFKPTIKNGRLIGRGASDMKSSVASFIAAADDFVNKNKNSKGFVIDGRDIGSVVFKKADLKLYIEVKSEIRAKRRYKQLIDSGEKSIYPQILKDIKLRDKKDKTRTNSPLVIPNDAHHINNENTFRETTNQINRLLKKL